MTDYLAIIIVCVLGIAGEAVRLVRPGQSQIGPDWLGRYRHRPRPLDDADGTSLQLLPFFPVGPTFRLGSAASPAEDPTRLDLDLARVRESAEQVLAASFLVEPFSQMMFLLLVVVSPVALLTGLIPYPWWFLGGCLLLFQAGLQVAFVVAHRRVLPGRHSKLIHDMILMLMFPPASVFACERLTAGALAGVHPLAAALVLCPEREAREVAGGYLRRWQHGLTGDDAAHAAATLATARTLLSDLGWDADTLAGPPPRDGDQSRSYCPRCHAQFLVSGGECPDCPGVTRVEFKA